MGIGFYPARCPLCQLDFRLCIHITKPVEPGSEGAKWLEQRSRERAERTQRKDKDL